VSDFILFVVVLATLIIGHELGHFIASKLTGVKVKEFGIGYPPRILTLFELKGTKYTLNWIPFGGFNLPEGEDDPSVPGGFAGASKLVRTVILVAGPAANIFLAFLAFLLAYKFSAPDFERVQVIQVVEGTPAAETGIMTGDIILRVDDQQIIGSDSMVAAVKSRIGIPIEIELLRGEQVITVVVTPREQYPSDQGPVGVTLGHPVKPMSWVEAAKIGIENIGLQVNAIIRLPGRLISGTASPEETRISGLKGIHDLLAWANSIDRSAQRPFLTLNMIGMISTGLALANLIPLPALDGGRLMFILIETVFRRRISPRYEGLVHAIGFTLLLALMIYFNLQDFVNPITLPK
jgi:regulator of sigma E protease